VPPERTPRRRKPQRFLPLDQEERQAEIAREEAAIRRQTATWGLGIKPTKEGEERQ